MTGAALVIQGDALRLPLADESVDLVVTSPPYFALRSYRDGDGHYDGQIGSEPTPADFLRALWAVMDECWRVLKPTGVAAVNLGDKYAGSGGHNNATLSKNLPGMGPKFANRADVPYASRRNAPDRYNQATDVRAKSVMGLPWRFALGLSIPDPYRTCYDPGDHPQWINRRPLTWAKVNSLPESVVDRPRASSEDWFILTKQGRYFSAIDEIRELSKPENLAYFVTQDEHNTDTTRARRTLQPNNNNNSGRGIACNPLGKLPGSVWRIPSEPLIVPEWAKERYDLPDHFAAFPMEWPRRLILAFSPNGICTVCGEGRRPVVDKQSQLAADGVTRKACGKNHGFGKVGSEHMAAAVGERFVCQEATITGYACACPEPTADTRPSVILDPFSGTGTTIGVARTLGRIGIGVDLSLDYCRLARWRVEQSGHFSKAVQRTAKERQGELLI